MLIVLAFRSEVDPDIHERMAEYIGEAWMSWRHINQPGPRDPTPEVATMVIYSGQQPWVDANGVRLNKPLKVPN